MFTIGGGAVRYGEMQDTWGVNPASAKVEVIGAVGLPVGTYVVFTIALRNFFGIITRINRKQSYQRCERYEVDMVDNRIRLQWAVAYCAFNIETAETGPCPFEVDSDLTSGDDDGAAGAGANVNLGAGSPPPAATPAQNVLPVPQQDPTKQRRYRHLLPGDWEEQKWTYTDDPLNARRIINYLFNGSGLGFSFSRNFHPDQLVITPLDLDFQHGVQLSNALSRINQMCGLDMTLDGAVSLRWDRIGTGPLPVIGGIYENPICQGISLETEPSQVRILGERNRYQVIDLKLEQDWNSYWEQFMAEPAWHEEVENVWGPFQDTKSGRFRRASIAREVTLREYVDATGLLVAADHRPYGDISRMDVPVWLYIVNRVYRSYRIPTDYLLFGTALKSLRISDGLIQSVRMLNAEAAMFPTSPDMEYVFDDWYPETKAFVIARGQPWDILAPDSQEHHGYYHEDEGGGDGVPVLNNTYRSLNNYQLDKEGYALLFDTPIFLESADPDKKLMVYPNQSVGDPPPDDTDYWTIKVPNPDFEVQAVDVFVSICFERERYHRDYGSGHRRGHFHESELRRDLILDHDGNQTHTPPAAYPGSVEVPYQDGRTADQKSADIASGKIAHTPTIVDGGFTRHGVYGFILSPAMSQITFRASWGSIMGTQGGGLEEEVRYGKRRNTQTHPRDITLERWQRNEELYDGERENNEEVRKLRRIAHYEKTDPREHDHPGSRQQVMPKILSQVVGNIDSAVNTVIDPEVAGGSEPLYLAGDVTWLDKDGYGSDNTGKRFGGVAIADQTFTGADVPVGFDGQVPVRVQGPFMPGDLVGCDFPDRIAKVGGQRPIGCINHTDPYEGEDVILAYVRLQHFDNKCEFLPYCVRPGEVAFWPGSVMIWNGDQIASCEVPTLDDESLDATPVPTWSGAPGADYDWWICFSTDDAVGRIEVTTAGTPPTPEDDELCGRIGSFTLDDDGNLKDVKVKHCGNIDLHCLGAGSSGSGSGAGSGGSGSGGPKSTAIIPVSYHPEGNAAIFCEESSEVRVHHKMFVDMGERPVRRGVFPIDPRWLEVCEPGTVRVNCTSQERGYMGSVVVGDDVILRAPFIPWLRSRFVCVELDAIRVGYLGVMLPPRTDAQREQNDHFIASAYDGATEAPHGALTPHPKGMRLYTGREMKGGVEDDG